MNMMNVHMTFLVILIYLCSVQGITFSAIGNVIDKVIFACGEKVVLVCSSSSVSSMDFRIDGERVAGCSGSSCIIFPKFNDSFTMDHAAGIYNFTIHSVKSSDNNRDFKCTINGLDEHIIPQVAEFPVNSTLEINSKSILTGTEIIATTGCVFPTEYVHFKWFTIKVSNMTDIKPYYANNKTEPNNSHCNPSPNCNGTGLSNSFVILNGSNLQRVFVEVHVIHQYWKDRSIAVHRTSDSFFVPDPDTSTTDITTVITTVTTSISPSQTTVTESSVTQSSISAMKTTTTTNNANTSLTSGLPTTKTNTTTISTISTTTSASSLPPSSTDNFTTSSSTVTSIAITGTEQNPNTDKTSTILIIAFCSIAGIALLLIVVFAINKIRKRHIKKKSGASNNHEMNTDSKNQNE